jgi:catechol 2,3-dioxygenase-like lactoylglutathione lyase family enzyme
MELRSRTEPLARPLDQPRIEIDPDNARPPARQTRSTRHHSNASRIAGFTTSRRTNAHHVDQCLVDDQDRALHFYTDVLGFQKKNEIPLGEHRWLTVVSPEEPDGTELVLEPDGHPAAEPFRALVSDGIPFTSFAVEDVHKEFERLRALGVEFTQAPAQMGPVTTAVFDDTCGNLIQIAQTD